MDLTTGDMLIFSGEGTEGTWERYEGARTTKAIRSRLSRERAGGDRWASAWIELEGLEDDGLTGATVYGKLGRDLDEIVDQRAVDEDDIEVNPAAQLRAGKPNPASAANGAKGGRPVSTTKYRITSRTGDNYWHDCSAKTLSGAKAAATRMYQESYQGTIEVGIAMDDTSTEIVSVKRGFGGWVDVP